MLHTTTTQIFAPAQDHLLKLLIGTTPERHLSKIKSNLASFPLMLAGTGLDQENKLKGLNKDSIGTAQSECGGCVPD